MASALMSKFSRQNNDNDEEEIIKNEEDTKDDTLEDEDASRGDDWLSDEDEGQLSVDVYQNETSIIIKSTIAGVSPEDIDISIDNDMLTIRGERRHDEKVEEDDYFYQECYWGAFSRSIILPVEVKAEEVEATLKNGVLTIRLPKAKKSRSVSIKVNTE